MAPPLLTHNEFQILSRCLGINKNITWHIHASEFQQWFDEIGKIFMHACMDTINHLKWRIENLRNNMPADNVLLVWAQLLQPPLCIKVVKNKSNILNMIRFWLNTDTATGPTVIAGLRDKCLASTDSKNSLTSAHELRANSERTFIVEDKLGRTSLWLMYGTQRARDVVLGVCIQKHGCNSRLCSLPALHHSAVSPTISQKPRVWVAHHNLIHLYVIL